MPSEPAFAEAAQVSTARATLSEKRRSAANACFKADEHASRFFSRCFIALACDKKAGWRKEAARRASAAMLSRRGAYASTSPLAVAHEHAGPAGQPPKPSSPATRKASGWDCWEVCPCLGRCIPLLALALTHTPPRGATSCDGGGASLLNSQSCESYASAAEGEFELQRVSILSESGVSCWCSFRGSVDRFLRVRSATRAFVQPLRSACACGSLAPSGAASSSMITLGNVESASLPSFWLALARVRSALRTDRSGACSPIALPPRRDCCVITAIARPISLTSSLTCASVKNPGALSPPSCLDAWLLAPRPETLRGGTL
mmetsp:Transcript_43982/g.91853  ORF Transcript_43982/g.91853 Transcript_43982/m.91853 type:complete len:318 (-) Transcript_43982:1727-2680(-)